MYDSIVLVLFFVTIIGVWIWLAGRMKRGGRGWFMRHFIGSTAGTFAGLVIVSLALALGIIEPKDRQHSSQQQAAAEPASSPDKHLPAYTVVKDEYKRDIKRSVEVRLPARVTKDELAAMAAAIKATATQKTNLTFIAYRLADDDGKGTAWATTHYMPELQITVLGLSLEGYQALSKIDVAKKYPDNKGAWLRDIGELSHVMVLYQRDGKYFIDQLFADGGKNTEAYRAKKLADGNLRLDEPDSSFHEYYVVKADGTLEGWGESGLYMNLRSLKMAH